MQFKQGYILWVITLLLFIGLAPSTEAKPLYIKWLTVKPRKLIPGSVALATYQGPKDLHPVDITWHQTAFPFFKDRKGHYQSLLAIPLPDHRKFETFVLLVSGDGKTKTSKFMLKVKQKHYRTITLNLGKLAILTPHIIAKIKREREILRQILSRISSERYWQGSFIKPVPGKVTSPFGTRRKINGIYISIHHGTDLRALMKTPVKAINSGKVVFCGNQTLTGLTVVIDHGLGLYSLYAHLSVLKTRKGSRIKKGEVIALSGNTGRATGPHLHLGIILCGIAIDPLSLLHLPL